MNRYMRLNRAFRWLLLGLFLSIFPAENLHSQSARLKGMILDAETNEPLPGANILVSSPSVHTGTASAANGMFQLENLPAGEYEIVISYIGYERKTINGIVLRDHKTKWLNITLFPTGIEINPITVTASKKPEKLLDAPATINIVEAKAIEDRMALTPTEHLKAMPAVDYVGMGINQSRVVVRGFNDLFSGSLLTLVDNRITRIPAVRLNAFQVIPTSNLDIDHMEVVLGPASALYGPNSAAGVLHVITKSPFDSKGTTVSVGGGERSVLMGTARHAGAWHDKIGYKFSVQYYQGEDFNSFDDAEIAARQAAIAAGADPDTLLIGRRIFDIESTAFDGRVDFRLNPDLKFIINGGFNRGDNIEMTDQGATQALNSSFNYIQARLIYKNLFLQTYMNSINTGDTYFLRTGERIINNSKLIVTQGQHHFGIADRQHFTYGFDILLTRPETKGTVNGRNEDHDNVDEVGAYLQSETDLTRKLKFIGAARIDHHNRLGGTNFSPRAAITFKPAEKHNFRLTFNEAFNTPTSDQLFADILAISLPTVSADPFLQPFIGDTFFNVRSLGTWPKGFHFNYGPDGRPGMVTPFGDYLVRTGYLSSPNAYLPPNVNAVWPALRDLVIDGASNPTERAFLEQLLPQQLNSTVPGVLKVLNTETQQFDPVDDSFVQDIPRNFETRTTSYEFGYKGLVGNKLLASVDVYHTRIKDFIGPLRVETPNVFVDADALASELLQDFLKTGVPAALAEPVAQQVVDGLAELPIGLVSPQEVQNGTDIILTNRNFGDVSVTGFDLSLTYYLNKKWTLTGNYSFVNKDLFKSEDGRFDIALNAPKNKFGAIVTYRNSRKGFDANLRMRFVDSFPVNSGIFVGKVNRYAVFDLNSSYRLPFAGGTNFSLTVQNLLNNKHKEFVGVPELGRLAWIRLTKTL